MTLHTIDEAARQLGLSKRVTAERRWGANPWVCALNLTVIHKNIDEVTT